MGAYATSAILLLLVMMLLGGAAFVIALAVGRFARRRQMRAAGGRGRSWGGRDYERMRSKYFQKEERARAARSRGRRSDNPFTTSDREPAPVESGSPLETIHRETLLLVGKELTAYTLREAYRQRIREYHPDRVALLGAKLRLLAEEETKRINEAYRYLNALVEHELDVTEE